MTIKTLDDGTSYKKAHAHDWEDPTCLIRGRVQIYRKIDGIRAIKNKAGRAWSRNSKPLPHIDHVILKMLRIFPNSWNETSSILGSSDAPAEPLTQENVYELSDSNATNALHRLGKRPKQREPEKLMDQYLAKGDEGLIVRVSHKGKILWWKIVPYKYADVIITGFKRRNQ